MKNKLLLFLGIFIILISATTGLASAASTETFVDDSAFSADGETGKPVSYNITLTHKAKLSIILSDECYGDYKIVITDKKTDQKIKTFTGNACFDEIKHTLTLSASQYTIRIYCTDEYYYFDGSLSITAKYIIDDANPMYSLKTKSVTMAKGDSYKISLVREPEGEMDKAKWSSSDKKIVTVSKSGKIKAVGVGNATVTVEIKGQKLKFKVKVQKLSLKSNAKVYVGNTVKLSVNSISKIKWSTSDSKIATVSSKGVVSGKKKGTATIYAKVNGTKLKCKVTVSNPKISKSTATVKRGKTITLSVIGAKEDKVVWKSSDKNIAKVSSKGVVTGLKKGSVTITATYNKKKYTCSVTVKHRAPIKVNSVDWYVNSVGGVEPEIKITNQSGRKIKYLLFETYYYNRVGDPAYCELDYTYSEKLRVVGPIKVGETRTYYWDPVIYNSSMSAIDIKTITVEYFDGTKEKYKYNTLWHDKYYYDQ